MNGREYQDVKLSDVKTASFNPKSRLQPIKLKTLQRSMSEVGLIYPIVVTKGGALIDGRRRLACAKALGWSKIQAIVVEADQAKIYAEVNYTAKAMTGNDSLAVWLKNPEAVSTTAAKRFESMQEIIGRPLIVELSNAGLSIRMYRRAMEVARYVGADEGSDYVKKVLAWMIEFGAGPIMQAVMLSQPASTMRKAIDGNKQMKMRLAV